MVKFGRTLEFLFEKELFQPYDKNVQPFNDWLKHDIIRKSILS